MISFKPLYLFFVVFLIISDEFCLGKEGAENKSKPHKESQKESSHKKKKTGATKSRSNVPYGYIDGAQCDRECDGSRRSCYFEFNIEVFYAMSKACYDCPNTIADCFREDCIIAGGVERWVQTVNRLLPGPLIALCQGDELMVHVINTMIDGEGTTIHWHGQHVQRDPYMDGVPFVTQCPIHHNNNFTYELWVDTPGTHWWHSHVEMQRGDGVFGGLVVRQPRSRNAHANRYDRDLTEHVILINDWNHKPRLEVFMNYAFNGSWLEPDGILVNGRGYQFLINSTDTPLATIQVQQGLRYRFRMINTGFFDCPLEFSIDGHQMEVIAIDGVDVNPVRVDNIVSSSGERFDFVLNANGAASTYWIRVKGYLTCERQRLFTVAALQYEGSTNNVPIGQIPTYDTAAPAGGIILNPVSKRNATAYSRAIQIDELRALQPIPYGLNTNSPIRYTFSFDMSRIDNPYYHRRGLYGFNQVDPGVQVLTPQINRISHKNLDVPMMPARFYVDRSEFCNENTLRGANCQRDFCQCPHVIQVPSNAVVEFIFMELFDQDDAPALHPVHLHGYSFYVLGCGELGRGLTKDYVLSQDRMGRLPRNYNNPPLKDTIAIPKGGYCIVRLLTDNIGYWFMHCHIDVHASEGMDVVVQVGTNYEMIDAPEDFPVCGNWPY